MRAFFVPGGEWVVVDSSASPKGCCDDGWFWHQVHAREIAHGLSDLPTVDVGSVEERLVAGVELGVGLLNLAAH